MREGFGSRVFHLAGGGILVGMKDFFVVDAAKFDNAVVTSFFVLSGLQVREKKQGGGQYLALTLTDKTGSLEARMWEEFAEALEHCSEGCYVKVQGQVSKYKGGSRSR